MKIFTFGGGRRLEYAEKILSDVEAFGELLLLPIPSTKDNIHVKGTDLLLSEATGAAGKGTYVCGYGIPEELRESLVCRGAEVFDGLLSEDFLSENAALTVEGALGHLLTSSDASIRELRIGVIGYGRIGSRLLDSLIFLGARVRLYTRSERLRHALGEEGIESRAFVFDGDYSGLDVLINTAPARILSEEKMSECEKAGLRIIDLASGECFPPSVSVLKLPSVPEVSYPKTAGRLYAEYIKKHFGGDKL